MDMRSIDAETPQSPMRGGNVTGFRVNSQLLC